MSAAARRRPVAAPSRRVPPSIAVSVRAVVARGLLDQRRAPLTWGGSLGALSVLILFTWPSIEGQIGELVKGYPQGLKEAFGITELNTVEAYFETEMLSLIVPLAVAFLAVRTICRGISTAEEHGWLETLLTTPLSREALVAGSFLVTALVIAAALVLTTAIALIAGVISGSDPSAVVIGRGIANVWPLAMFFAGLAVLLAGRFHSAAPVTAVASGVLVAMYLLDVAGRVAEVEVLQTISAFRYYGSAIRDGIDPLAFVGLTLAGVLLAGAGALLFRRRDVFV